MMKEIFSNFGSYILSLWSIIYFNLVPYFGASFLEFWGKFFSKPGSRYSWNLKETLTLTGDLSAGGLLYLKGL